VDPVAGAAKAAQVVRAGGRLAVFCYAFQPPPSVAEALAEVHRQVMPDAPNLWARPILDAYLMMCSTAADGIGQAGAFGGPEQRRFGWKRPPHDRPGRVARRSRFSTERCSRSAGTTGQRNRARSSSLMLVQSQ
jgi:hypothetical protein